jgi:hypothetical protein
MSAENNEKGEGNDHPKLYCGSPVRGVNDHDACNKAVRTSSRRCEECRGSQTTIVRINPTTSIDDYCVHLFKMYLHTMGSSSCGRGGTLRSECM